jgi:D-arabinose 1-dehydrogenase-like Zn-dependent alcohol dehydrogenase
LALVGIGVLGHLAVQYAKAAGFHTLAVSHSPDKDGLIHELGADEIVRDGKGLMEVGGADVILGTSNSMEAMGNSIQGLRPDGRLVIMGFEAKPLMVTPADLIMKRVRIIGSQQNHREYLYEALQIAASGKVRVKTEVFPFDNIKEAYKKVEEGKVRFRAVVSL